MTTKPNMEPGDMPGSNSFRKSLVKAIATLIKWWAMLGGVLVSGVAVMTASSATSQVFFDKPFSSDYELTKYFVGIAIFTFLPYCQLMGANVSVDIFTEGLSESKKALMSILTALFALAFSALLLRQMFLGFEDYLRFPEVTPVLQIPLWTAFPPILISLALLLAAAVITFIDSMRVSVGRAPFVESGGAQVSE
jgi:TRAP-type C4-dicarboxylate transport system permease small subunit